VLFRSERAGAVDLSLDPNNPRVLFAAVWQAQRMPWAMTSGGPDSGLWRSADGGDTWTDISRNPGMPRGVLGRIGVAVSPADGRRVYAVVEAEDGALFRSDDGGATWQRGSEEAGLRGRIVRELGRPEWPAKYDNRAFEVRAEGNPPDVWKHEVHGTGDDAGLVFLYRWEPVRPDLELFNRRDPLLELL